MKQQLFSWLLVAWCASALLLAAPLAAAAEEEEADTHRRESVTDKPVDANGEDLGDVIGIDLGTTYSCVAVIKAGGVEIIPNDQGNRITPSYVAFLDDGTRVVGDAAKNQASMNPKNTIFDVKRLIGRRFNDRTVQHDKKLLPYSITNRDGKPYVQVSMNGKAKDYSPEEISAMILSKMKSIAETYLGHEVKNAVITCPAYFNDAQRQATKDAGAIAGLNVLRIINEPTAAALAYGLDKRSKGGHNILVFDLGGGTFDVTVLTIDDGVFEVQATNGDTHLGGEDFDQRIVEHFLKLIQTKHKQDVSKDLRALSKLRREAEKAKRALSTVHEVRVEIDGLWDGGDFSEVLTRAKFEELNKDLFEKTIGPVTRVLKDAGLKKTAINEIVLVGGSTRIPKVQQLLMDFFDGKELNQEINPDEAVAYGAAVQGGIFSGKGITTDLLLLDVTPMSLGTAEVGGVFSRIIERNSPIPTKKSAHYTTVEDDQEILTVEVYQGERAKVKHNILLGKFDLQLVPQPRGVPDIKVTFEIDANGILHVEAEDTSSGVKGNIVITRDKNSLSEDDLQRMREDAEKYAEEDKAFQEKNDAKRELEEYCYVLKKRVEGDKLMAKKFKKQIRQAVNKVLDWLEDIDIDTAAVSKKSFRNKKKNLKDEVETLFSDAKKDSIARSKARAKAKAEGKPLPKEEEEEDDDDDEEEERRSRRRRRTRDDDESDDEADGEDDGKGGDADDDTKGSEGEVDLEDFDLDKLMQESRGEDDSETAEAEDEPEGPVSAEEEAEPKQEKEEL